jgi:hypothetical protein
LVFPEQTWCFQSVPDLVHFLVPHQVQVQKQLVNVLPQRMHRVGAFVSVPVQGLDPASLLVWMRGYQSMAAGL